MYFVIPYYMVKHSVINSDNIDDDNTLITKVKIILLYTTYIVSSSFFYSFFKGEKKDWFTLILYSDAKMEFIALISIIFTSLFSGYSSMQCVFNYLIHPYCLGGKFKLFNYQYLFKYQLILWIH